MSEELVDDVKLRKLKPEIAAKLTELKPLLAVPNDLRLSKADWMELLASWHFLAKVSRYEEAKATSVMEERKPHLADYISFAKAKLTEFELL